MTASDFLEIIQSQLEHQNILNVAPGEGNNTPLSIFKDAHYEELAYPGIFLGQPQSDMIKKNWLVCTIK